MANIVICGEGTWNTPDQLHKGVLAAPAYPPRSSHVNRIYSRHLHLFRNPLRSDNGRIKPLEYLSKFQGRRVGCADNLSLSRRHDGQACVFHDWISGVDHWHRFACHDPANLAATRSADSCHLHRICYVV